MKRTAIKIKQLRDHLKISQIKFSEKLNVTQAHVSMYETGTREPTEETVRDMVKVFGMSFNWYYNDSGQILNNGKEKSTVTDISNIKLMLEELLARVARSESTNKILVSEIYAMKNNLTDTHPFSAEKVLDMRTELRLTQSDFGLKIDINQKIISMWENGRRIPTSDDVKKFIDIFGMSKIWYFNSIGPMFLTQKKLEKSL